jgi:hypothetical protein
MVGELSILARAALCDDEEERPRLERFGGMVKGTLGRVCDFRAVLRDGGGWWMQPQYEGRIWPPAAMVKSFDLLQGKLGERISHQEKRSSEKKFKNEDSEQRVALLGGY